MGSRRSFLKQFGFGLVGLPGLLTTGKSQGRHSASADYEGLQNDNESFRIVHLTDTHVTSKRKGDEGYRACIESLRRLNPSPELILMGGDMVFDGLYTDFFLFEESARLFKEISDSMDIPYYPCIGNHDVLGLSSRRKVPVDHPGIGKKYIMQHLGMETDYYSFNHRGWHFVVLNSIYEVERETGPAYEVRIGQQQLDWLRHDLGQHQHLPTIAVSHVAAFAHKGQINNDFEMKAMSSIVLQDNIELRKILERHHVKALLQGHTHIREDFRFNDVWYITSQAASAAWWGGNWLGFKPGYTVLELGNKDILDWYTVEFDWQHQLEPGDTLERERIEEQLRQEQVQDSLYREEIKR